MIYERIRNLREDNDFTQTQIAQILNVDQRTYSSYEIGTRMISLPALCAVADFYHVSVDYLLNRTDNKEINR